MGFLAKQGKGLGLAQDEAKPADNGVERRCRGFAMIGAQQPHRDVQR